MSLWFAYRVQPDGNHCVGQVWAGDSVEAYAVALEQLHCRVDYVSQSPA